jgi:hypothetical protein
MKNPMIANPEIILLENKLEELRSRAAVARIKADYINVYKFELLTHQCHEKLMEALDLQQNRKH